MAGVYGVALSGSVCSVMVNSEGQLGCSAGGGGQEGKEGKEGTAGATGATGPTGPEGKVGKAGATGSTGASGPAGNAASATFASFTGVPSGNCLNYTGIATPGNGTCPRPTTGFSTSPLLTGTFDNGATVTNLYAETNVTMRETETATVAVIDNTTAKTLLSCTVEKSKSSCGNTGTGGTAAAGDNIEVKVTAPGFPRNGRALWRVRFRY